MHRLTDFEKQRIRELYELGKMDSEISKELGIKRATIQYHRSHNNMPTKFTYSKISKIDNQKFEELFSKGLSDYAIAKELNLSPDGIYSHRMRHGYLRDINLRLNTARLLTDFQKQVLLGTMLGDASFKMGSGSVNPSIQCSHGILQKEYCEYKTQIFEDLGAHCNYHKRNIPDKRNGKLYEDYTMFIPANPELLSWYKAFYKPKKVIPFELFDYFTEVSLAFMYMDDGSKSKDGYCIATNSFTKDDIFKFRIFLMEKFKLETSMFKNHVLYIKKSSASVFTSLIKPHIIPCMQYKLHI